MCMHPIRSVLVLAFVATILWALPAHAQESYDVVIRGGRVMDPETGLDGIRNIGIRGQTIVAISEDPLNGETVVDAAGLVVAPGFIDLHAHGQSNDANRYQARDGVTTALELESGVPDARLFLQGRQGDAILNFGATIAHSSARTAPPTSNSPRSLAPCLRAITKSFPRACTRSCSSD